MSDPQPTLWRCVAPIHDADTMHMLTALDDLEETPGLVSSGLFEEPDDSDLWHVELTFSDQPDDDAMSGISATLSLPMNGWHIDRVENKSWLEEVAKNFPPVTIGPYHIVGSHITEPSRDDQIRLQIDAGLAFGSGEHGTTAGCLLSFEHLCASRSPSCLVDLGSGSGILAIAAAKRLDLPVLATDYDDVAVRVCNENARINGVAGLVHCIQADGTHHPDIHARGPYDLVFANILANTLLDMAEGIASITASGGLVILSGLLITQSESIETCYQNHGFTTVHRHPIAPWMTLSMQMR